MRGDRIAADNLIDMQQRMETMRWAPECHQLAFDLDASTKLMRTFLNVHGLAA